MTATEITYQNFFFSGEIPCQKKATGEKKCVSALQFFNQPEGYVKNEDGKFGYVYQYKDHLGNVRLSYTDTDASGDISQDEIIQENHYMPFGLKMRGFNNVVNSNGNSVAEKRMFGGKEYNEELGLNWYDITARNYDPALGRWMNLDPKAEEMRRHSPYNYAFNNPIYFLDPDGMKPFGCPDGNCDDDIVAKAKKAAKDIMNSFIGLFKEAFNIQREKELQSVDDKVVENAKNERAEANKKSKDKFVKEVKEKSGTVVKGMVYVAADKTDEVAGNVSDASVAVTLASGGTSAL